MDELKPDQYTSLDQARDVIAALYKGCAQKDAQIEELRKEVERLKAELEKAVSLRWIAKHDALEKQLSSEREKARKLVEDGRVLLTDEEAATREREAGLADKPAIKAMRFYPPEKWPHHLLREYESRTGMRRITGWVLKPYATES